MNEQTRPAPPQPPAQSAFRPLDKCRTLGEAFHSQELVARIRQAAPKSMDPQSMLRTWAQATSKQPNLLKCELRQSLGAFMSLAYLGLVPNTHLNQAHIIPFKKMLWNKETRQRDIETWEPQIIIGYPGYLELAHRSGIMKSIHCDVVFDRRLEQFSYAHGSNRHLEHHGLPHDFVPRGDPQFAYAYARLRDSEEQFEVLTWDQVITIRDRSNAYKNALEAKLDAENKNQRRLPPTWSEAPWVRDPVEMAKKTAARRLIKWLPKSPDSALAGAASLEDAQDRGGLDFGSVIDGTAVPLDGAIPFSEPPAEPPPDPASAFGDRRPSHDNVTNSHDNPTNSPRASQMPPSRALPFDAVLISATGEPGDEVFEHPVAWARAYAHAWETRADGTEQALAEHNADTLTDARRDPQAARILDSLQASPEPLTIEPPQERGRTVWMDYVTRLKHAIPGVRDGDWPDWVNAQQDVLATVPMTHRALAVRAITEACTARTVPPPPWLGALMAPPGDPDKTWVDMRITDVSKINDRPSFEKFLSGQDVSATMVRLKQQRPELFARADMAFTAKHHELPDA